MSRIPSPLEIVWNRYGKHEGPIDLLCNNAGINAPQLAFEWDQYGIRVNAVAPTFIWTNLTASTLGRPGMEEKLIARIPLGRLGVPADVAPAVAFLLSDQASLITGHVLAIDNGYTIH